MTTTACPPEFTIPTDRAALLSALDTAQFKYEVAKRAQIAALHRKTVAEENAAQVKRSVIKSLTESGVPITRAKEEYVDADEWRRVSLDCRVMEELKLAAEETHSIASQRLFTLRAAVALVAGTTGEG